MHADALDCPGAAIKTAGHNRLAGIAPNSTKGMSEYG